jgi:hypothetical protein
MPRKLPPESSTKASQSPAKTAPVDSSLSGRFVAIGVPIIAALIGSIGGLLYTDIKTLILPDVASGEYVALKASDEINAKPDSEYIKLRSHDGSVSGEGRSGSKRWAYAGFLKVGYLVMSYRSEAANSIGFGQYFLEQKNPDGSLFIGRMQGDFCPERVVKECNVVLVKGEAGGKEENDALKQYGVLLAQQCKPVGISAPNLSCPDSKTALNASP